MIRHLPTTRANYIDRKATAGTLAGVNKSVLLIGYCSNDLTGEDTTLLFPMNEPVEITDIGYAYNLTRNHDGTPSELSEALYEAVQESPTSLWMYRMGQVYSKEEKICNIVTSGDYYEVAYFSSEAGNQTAFANATLLSSDARYTALTAAYTVLEDYQFDYVVPIGAYIDNSTTPNDFGYQLAKFCYEMSTDVRTTVGVLGTNTALSHAYKTDATINYRTGTPTGTQVTTWANMLTGTGSNYGVLNFDPKTPGSLTVYPEDETSIAAPTNHAYFRNIAGNTTPTTYTAATVKKDADGIPIDMGKHVCVVAANARFSNRAAVELHPTKNFYNKCPYVAVAAILSTLPVTSSLTNRPTSILLQEKLIRDTISDKLTGFGYITLTDHNGYRAFGVGWTAAYHVSQYSKSDYDVESTKRIAGDIVTALRNAVRPFLGSRGQLQGINQVISSTLMNFVKAGALEQGYSFEVKRSPIETNLGIVRINLNLTIAPEIRQIFISTRLSS